MSVMELDEYSPYQSNGQILGDTWACSPWDAFPMYLHTSLGKGLGEVMHALYADNMTGLLAVKFFFCAQINS